jgi:hypothetical protein
MKTTIEIADPLLSDAKKLAARDGTTLRELVEQGLRQIIRERRKPSAGFKLRDASFKGGKGLTPEFADAGWEKIRDEIYKGRGG